MNKSDLVAAMAAKTGDSKKATDEALRAFVDVVTDALVKGDKVQLVGFGSFEVRTRAARKGHKTLLMTSNIKNIADMPCNPVF